MKKTILIFALGALVLSCGNKEKKEKKDDFEMSRSKKEEKKEAVSSDGVPIDLKNKGVGPIKSVSFEEEIDKDMASRGEKEFNTICIACHTINERMIGPPMAGIYQRRSPEWVMNMILNPDGMLKEDPIAQALQKEYNNAIMLNQNLSEEQARDLAEYLRTL